MTRHGRYYEIKQLILEYLVTSTDRGICPRPTIAEKFRIKNSSATDMFRSMKNEGLIRIGKRSFDNIQSIEITDKGRSQYASLYKREATIPLVVRRYLVNRKIKPDDLFSIQKDFVERGLIESTKNVCIFGYPGSGKTLDAEMAIAGELERGGKVLYCTPYKALDWQKFTEFEDSFRIFEGVKILIADGDSPVSNEDLTTAKIVIATYERIMGAIRSKEKWIQNISLVCADEITLLADEERGGTLDTILTYLRGHEPRLRILTISSLVENTIEIAKWLDAELIIDNRPAFNLPINEYLIYRENNKIVKWYRNGKKEVVDGDKPLDMIIRNNLQSEMTTIVFTGTRDGTRYIAESLAKLHKHDPKLDNEVKTFLTGLKEKSSQVERICRMIPHGIAYHHAGLQRKVRRFVEDLIRRDMLKTVVATTTLSHGIDYKIDSVVIDTSPIGILRNLRVYEYINLKGRTGRPGKSLHANVYLLCGAKTAQSTFTKYFSSAPEPIHPNATISDINLSLLILSYSYPEIDLEQVTNFVNKTFCCTSKPIRISELRRVSDRLVEHGFLLKSGSKLIVTELGLRANQANLSAQDVLLLLASNRDAVSLLRTSMQIDIIRRMKLNSELISHGLTIIKGWTNGQSLDSIRKSTSEDFHDQDMLDLVSYTSLSLRKMAIFFQDERIRKTISDLQEKISKRTTKS